MLCNAGYRRCRVLTPKKVDRIPVAAAVALEMGTSGYLDLQSEAITH